MWNTGLKARIRVSILKKEHNYRGSKWSLKYCVNVLQWVTIKHRAIYLSYYYLSVCHLKTFKCIWMEAGILHIFASE